jgi:rhamnogalacturonyl hydrolase YesR
MAVDWLCRAQDVSVDDGVSYGYSLRGGWRESYIETTGYILRTFFNLAKHFGRAEYRDRAIRMARWLQNVQNPDGSFSNPHVGTRRGIVFDTGQDLLGLMRAYRETGDETHLSVAQRAGAWLVAVADAEGRWTRSTYNAIPHVYNTRVAWGLLELQAAAPDPDYLRVARANLDWAVSQQTNGWFDNVAFVRGVAPYTHTIAYAIRGLWESSRLWPEPAWEQAAQRGADAMLSRLRLDGWMPGQIDRHGRPAARYCCLTGNAQMAIIWHKLYAHTEQPRYREAAERATRYVMAAQDVETSNDDIRGAVAGSYPIWGGYSPFTYPNWATKFLIDALLVSRGYQP